MSALQITLMVQLDGADADDVAHDLALLVEAGNLDHAVLGLLRVFLAPIAGDWKIAHALCGVARLERASGVLDLASGAIYWPEEEVLL